MTKKLFLTVSAILNFIMLILSGYMTYSLWASVNSGSSGTEAASGFAALGAALVMVIFGIVTVILLVAFILKLISVKVEHNAMTFFAMLFDIALVVFAVAINQNAFAEIIAGNVSEHIGHLLIVAASALPLVCDILSFPAESSK